jgi:hypothetical protein
MSDIDYTGITENQRETWASDDFNPIARQNVGMAEALCEAVDPHPDERVLDILCGSVVQDGPPPDLHVLSPQSVSGNTSRSHHA